MAISALGFQLFGWAKVKQFPLPLAVLLVSLMAAPLGGITYLARPHALRIRALVHPVNSALTLPGDCPFFPKDNVWNTKIDELPVDSHSAAYVAAMGSGIPLHPDFGSSSGYEYSTVGRDETIAFVAFTEAAAESDPGPYRIPDDAVVEEGSDHHVLLVDPARCRLYELYEAKKVASRKWEAASGAIFDLRSNRLRPAGWTSADAAGLPIQAGLVRYDEVLSGAIHHALRFTTPHTRNAFVWPATHRASSLADPNLPAMGQRFRLRRSFEVSGFSPEIQVVLVALKDYGMILADNGGPWFISGARDSRWSSGINSEFRRLHGSDFEAVNSSLLMVTPDSAQARGIISR